MASAAAGSITAPVGVVVPPGPAAAAGRAVYEAAPCGGGWGGRGGCLRRIPRPDPGRGRTIRVPADARADPLEQCAVSRQRVQACPGRAHLPVETRPPGRTGARDPPGAAGG